jgi:hypothetical protein
MVSAPRLPSAKRISSAKRLRRARRRRAIAPDPSPSHDDMLLVHYADFQRGNTARRSDLEVGRSSQTGTPNFDLRHPNFAANGRKKSGAPCRLCSDSSCSTDSHANYYNNEAKVAA